MAPLPDEKHRGFYGRGYIPHYDSADVIQFVTYHLADSLPREVVEQMRQELRQLPEEQRDVEKRRRIEAYIDAGHGCCVMRQPEAAKIVEDAFLFFHGERYDLHAWAVMPNHVHVLFAPYDDWPLGETIRSWGRWTGTRLFDMMPHEAVYRTGKRRVWLAGYWDRYIRHEEHYQRALSYIHRNPVKAGFVERPEDYRWCSAWSGRR